MSRFEIYWGDFIFDAVILLASLPKYINEADFAAKVCPLLRADPGTLPALVQLLYDRKLARPGCAMAPLAALCPDWRPAHRREYVQIFANLLLYTRPTGYETVAEILDLARLLDLTGQDLQFAIVVFSDYSRMTVANWQALLESCATSHYGQRYEWDKTVMAAHVLLPEDSEPLD